MSVLPIVICGEPVLHRPTTPVPVPVADQLGLLTRAFTDKG